jgi:hypothetical protein
MRVVAVYDSVGNILSLMSIPRDRPSGSPPVRAGERSSEFNVSEIPDDLDPKQMSLRLEALAKGFKVATEHSPPRLVPKTVC